MTTKAERQMVRTATSSESIPVRLKEWEVCAPDRGNGAFLRDVRLTPRARETASALTASRQLSVVERIDGPEIHSFSYIGRIHLDPLVITIEPKIPGKALLSLFRYAYGLRDLKLSKGVDYSLGGTLFLDLLVAQLHAEALELFERGLTRQYIERNEDLGAPRGRIDIQAMANRAGLTTGTLPCRHFPRIEDCLANQVLLAGLKLGRRIATDKVLIRRIRRLEKQLAPGVTAAILSWPLLSRAKRSLNRLTRAYEPAVSLIEILFSTEQASLDENDTQTRLPGFLFDMNHFFQALLDRFLREHLNGVEFRSEFGISHMFHYITGANPRGRRSPKPRPDFAVLSGGRVRAMLDAKYKDLWNQPVSRDILYQLTLYAMSNELKEATILYPTTQPGIRDQRIEFSDPISGNRQGEVVVRGVDLMEMARVVEGGRSDRGAGREMAGGLVWGASRLT